MGPGLARILDRITTLVLIALAVAVLLDRVGGVSWAAGPERALALALAVLAMPRFGVREWVLLGLAVALTYGLWGRDNGPEAVIGALGKGAYFAAFILLLMLLREGAVTSKSVLAVGQWISRQPPGRRFTTTFVGGHVAGILMNFGAVSLLSPLIQRGVRADPVTSDDEARRVLIRERRQLSALIRGFAPVITWAPTTLTQVIILSVVPGVDPALAIAYGLGLTALVFAIGWTEDRLRWGPARIAPAPLAFPGAAAWDLAAVYALLIGGAVTFKLVLDLSLPLALMTVAPLMLVGWVLSQNRGPDMLGNTTTRMADIATNTLPRMAKEAYMMGVAGFIGITAAKLAPVDRIALWLESAHIPAWALVAALPVVISLAGQVALSPMMMVVFLAAVISSLPTLPAAPEHIAVALAAGWMLSLTSAPNATGALLISAATGIKPVTITWRWNGVYSVLVMAVLAAVAWVIV